MAALLLGIFVPLAYLVVAAFAARHVRRTIKTDDYGDATACAAIVGVFWPVVMPFYLALCSVPNKHIEDAERARQDRYRY